MYKNKGEKIVLQCIHAQHFLPMHRFQRELKQNIQVDLLNTAVEGMILTHELTHIIHAATSNSSGNWVRPLANVIVQEGLAMKVSQKLVEGLEEYSYVSHDQTWFESIKNSRDEIISGIQPYIKDDKSETIFKFTMGLGTTNHIREAYFAA